MALIMKDEEYYIPSKRQIDHYSRSISVFKDKAQDLTDKAQPLFKSIDELEHSTHRSILDFVAEIGGLSRGWIDFRRSWECIILGDKLALFNGTKAAELAKDSLVTAQLICNLNAVRFAIEKEQELIKKSD